MYLKKVIFQRLEYTADKHLLTFEKMHLECLYLIYFIVTSWGSLHNTHKGII